MPFPNFAGKHAEDALVRPADYLAYMRGLGGVPDAAVPVTALLLFQASAARRAFERHPFAPFGYASLHVAPGSSVGLVAGFGIGAPVTAIVVEELIAIGVRRFVIAGTAGALSPALGIGDTIVCSDAIRDEGVSHHYLDAAEDVRPSPGLTTDLRGALHAAGISFTEGPTWTIDAPYRETIAEARHYRDAGVLTVEMEAASLFAVATHRGVEAAAAFVVSDSLAELEWNPQFHSSETAAGLDALIDAALTLGRERPSSMGAGEGPGDGLSGNELKKELRERWSRDLDERYNDLSRSREAED